MNNNWTKLKRSTMKPTNTGFKPANYTTPKKKPAKRKPSFEENNPVLSKLLDLKYRINNAYRNREDDHMNTIHDKSWVIKQIDDVRNGRVLSKNNMLKANDIWRKYEG